MRKYLLPANLLRGVVKKNNGLFTVRLTIRVDPPPPSTVIFFKGCIWPLIMMICILKRILHQKSNIWYIDKVKGWELMSIVRTRQSTIVSIGNHEKGMKNALFSPLTMKCLISIKESYSKGEKANIFTHAYGQAMRGDPSLMVRVTMIYPFFSPSLFFFFPKSSLLKNILTIPTFNHHEKFRWLPHCAPFTEFFWLEKLRILPQRIVGRGE